jgi:hypothetical protein
MFGLTADMLVAAGAAGQSVTFYPMVVRNWRRHYCHFPLWVAALKIGFMSVSFVGLLVAGLPMAAVVVVVDIGSWAVLAVQRQTWGDGTNPRLKITKGGYWWCPDCLIRVPASAVTNNERHDERDGGCGERVMWETYP